MWRPACVAVHILLNTGCFKKELCNSIRNVTVWRVLRERLHLKMYEVSIVQHLYLSINVFKIYLINLPEANSCILATRAHVLKIASTKYIPSTSKQKTMMHNT
jgi:hypothetical protein